MKRKLLACLFAVIMLVGSATISMAGPFPGEYFGKLTMTEDVGGSPFIAHLVGTNYSFKTFCLERNEWVKLDGTEYNAYLNSEAVNGGYSGGSPDPLDPRTAYLYYDFITGTSGTNYNAWALQVAIWKLEGEDNGDALWNLYWANFGVTALSYIADAEAAGWKTTRGVEVLNLYTLNGNVAQDFLKVPEPLSLLLLGFGLLGLGITRKLKK